MASHNNTAQTDPWDEFQLSVQVELEQSRRALKEIGPMLEQSQTELAKLTQRNATITGHLQQVQSQIETMPRADIRTAYNAALDTQQRLLVMRGQLEKMQSDYNSLQKYVAFLEKVEKFGSSRKGSKSGSGSALLEMLVKAQESERQRLSRRMHDGPAQALSNFIVQTEIASRLFDLDPNKAKEEMSNMKQAAMLTFDRVRHFIFELRPMSLDDLGLFATMKRYVDAYKEQTGLEVNLNLRGQEMRFEPYLEVMVFRALQELMGNAARHNHDASNKIQLNVGLTAEDNLIKVNVSDNGKGFDPTALPENVGVGLKVIRERVEMLGGYIEIDSTPGEGARITFQVPCSETTPALPGG
jgi:two-component system sensor histidine kinase DegS